MALSSITDMPLAIVGMACRLPRADGVEAYWSLLRSGGCAIRELPPERLNRRLYYDPRKGIVGKTYTSIAGIVEPRPIDPMFCPLSRKVIEAADESHVALCEVAGCALASGGRDPLNMPTQRAGVYIGHSRGAGISGQLRYATMVETTAQWLREIEGFDARVGDAEQVIDDVVRKVRAANPHRRITGEPNVAAHEAARMIARAFHLEGPYTSVNAACASSLMALSMGARALQLGNIDMAVVGGASHCKVDSLVLFSKAQSASATGSRPFDADADGLVAAEGFVVFVLKTLERALADRDPIQAVIRGIGVSSDGHGKSLWAPRKEGQIEAVRRAYGQDVEMNRLGMIEAHATSTQLGDATELSALIEALSPAFPAGKQIPIGSVKGNIGHALESAGAAGLLKAVLAIRHQEIPPSIGVNNLNPKIDWQQSPLFVPTKAMPFSAPRDGGPRRAAVNSFGIGGLNAHIVVDEFQESTKTSVAVTALPRKEFEPIAIISVAGILPGVRTVDELYSAMQGSEDYRSLVADDRWKAEIAFEPGQPQVYKSVTRWGGFAAGYEYDWRRHKVPPKQVANADPLQFMFLDAVDQALKSANLNDTNWNRQRTGCLVGTRFTGEFPTQLQMGLRLPEFRETLHAVLAARGMAPAEIDAFADQFSQILLERMPALNDETGSFTTSTLASRITKTFDLMGGAAAVDAGDLSSEVVLELCVEALQAGQADMMICAGGQRALGLPDYEELSLNRVITREENDGRLTPRSIVPGEGAVVVLLKRLADAKRDGNKIIAVIDGIKRNPKATDMSAARLIETGIGQFGHLLGGAGMVALAKSAILSEKQAGRRVVVESVGAEDLNYEITVAGAGIAKPRAAEVWRGFYWLGNSLPELIGQLHIDEQTAAGLFANPSPASFGESRWRLGIVAKDAAHLREQCHFAVSRLPHVSTHCLLRERGIFCREVTGEIPLTAFCFPGQGSQSPGMLQELVRHHPIAAREVESLDAIQQRLGYPRFAQVAWDEADLLGTDVWRTQLSMLLADRVMLACLEELGVVPDRMVGHSYGELVALQAAGVWSLETVAHATFARCEAINACRSDLGKMLSTNAPREKLTELLSNVSSDVHLAAINGPQQMVVGGAEHALAKLDGILQSQGYDSQLLKVPRPFHTPLMAGAQASFADALATLRMGPTRVPVLSTVNAKYVADPDDIRGNLVEQLTQPVQYQAVIERLHAEGVKVFIEVGPRQTLTQLNRQILGDADAWLLPMNHSKRSDLQQLAYVRAAIQVLGLAREKVSKKPTGATLPRVEVKQKAAPQIVEVVEGLPILRLTGSPYEMGYQHGSARREQIMRVLQRSADQVDFPARPLPSLERALTFAETFFGENERAELQGIADAVEVPLASIIAHNLRMYPDLDGGCVHFAVCNQQGNDEQILHGANEDLPLSLALGDCITRTVQLRFEADAVPYLTFAADGQLGGINGVNAHGVAVTSAMLLDSQEVRLSRGGLLHAVVVRRVLEQARDLDSAVAILKECRGAGAWNVCVSHSPTKRLAYVEYDEHGVRTKLVEHQIVASNHSRWNDAISSSPQHSLDRLSRLRELLREEQREVSPQVARQALRDRFDIQRGKVVKHATMSTVCRVDNQLSVLMRPTTGELWLTHGRQTSGNEEEFVKLDLQQLFGNQWPSTRPQPKTESPATEAMVVKAELQSVVIDWPEFIRNASGPATEPPSFGHQTNVCQRFVMRLLKQELNSSSAFRPSGSILVVGPAEVAASLQKRFGSTEVVLISETENIETACAKLRDAWQRRPITHMFLATPWSGDSQQEIGQGRWQERRQVGVLLPYFVCQEWFKLLLEAGLLDQATLAAAVRLDGEFGFAGNVAVPESGALCGLLKGLFIEYTRAQNSGLKVKIVDFSEGTSFEEITAKLCQEIAVNEPDYEIAYRQGERHVVRPVIASLETSQPQQAPSGQWIVTGGARGVTAVVARELAERFGVTLHLIGSSSLSGVDPAWCDLSADALKQLKMQVMKENMRPGEPPIKAWLRVERAIEVQRNLKALQAAGIQAHYYACDISDAAALQSLVNDIRCQHGSIEGIVHGAGFESACRFDKKKRADVERTLAVKVDGAVHLIEATRNDPLKYFLAFGSISGRFGGMGQTDYCLANDLLAKIVGRLRADRPACRSTVYHWHSWDEVGMAVRPESKHIKDMHGIRFMPTREGAKHFVDELLAGTPENEVLITDWQYYKRFYPDPIVAPKPHEEIQEQVAPRHVLRLVPAALSSSKEPFRPQGPCAIYGDGPRAKQLEAELVSRGAVVHLLSADHSALEQFAALCGKDGVPHLFLVTEALGNTSCDQGWQARREANLVLPFKLVQRWLAHLPVGFQGASVVGVTALGGDFGLNAKPAVPESGALCGLLKSLHVETLVKGERQILVKVLDFTDSETPHAVARHVLNELIDDAAYVEFAYRQGIRQRIAAVREDLTGIGEHQIKRGGQWLVTGGARGFTAQMALRLARDYDLRLQLLGSSPLPDRNSVWHGMNAEDLQAYKRELTKQALASGRTPATLWQPIQTDLEIQANLNAYREAGIEVHYHSCDLGNHEQLAKVLEDIRKQHGPIDGLLHGAGVRHTVRLEQVTPEQFADSLRAKVDGTISLMTLTEADPIKHFVSFGSLGGRFGTNGGSDYAMVNETLAKLTGWYRQRKTDCAAVTMHWHAIAGVGMMTRPQSFGPAAVAKLNLMSVDEAYQHLRRELLAGCPESEVLTTDGEYHQRFYPADAVVLDLPAQQVVGGLPLLEKNTEDYWPLTLDPVNDLFLKEHRFKRKPLLPMVAGVEALAEAAVGELATQYPFELHNIRVHQPFKFFTDKPIAAKVVSENVDGTQHLKLVADFRNRSDQLVQANRLYLSAEFAGKCHAEQRRLAETIPGKFNNAWYPDDERSIYHGPSFRCVKQASTSDLAGWTKIVAPDPNGLNGPHGNGNWIVPSVVLDGALFSCGIYFYIHRPGTVAIPLGIEQLRVFGVPQAGEECLCHYQLKDTAKQQASFDFVLYDAQGRELVSAVNYQAALFREVMV